MRTLTRIVVAALIGFSSPALAETSLRIAGGILPPGKGNPLRNSAQPYWYIYAAMFDTLTHVNSAGEVEPWLAERWEQTSPRTWRFHLRPNVAFTNGEPVDATAVVATIAYLTSADGQREAVASRMPKGLTATVIDPLTVDLTVPDPDPLLPRRFHELWILPPKQWAAQGPEKFAAALPPFFRAIEGGTRRMKKTTPKALAFQSLEAPFLERQAHKQSFFTRPN